MDDHPMYSQAENAWNRQLPSCADWCKSSTSRHTLAVQPTPLKRKHRVHQVMWQYLATSCNQAAFVWDLCCSPCSIAAECPWCLPSSAEIDCSVDCLQEFVPDAPRWFRNMICCSICWITLTCRSKLVASCCLGVPPPSTEFLVAPGVTQHEWSIGCLRAGPRIPRGNQSRDKACQRDPEGIWIVGTLQKFPGKGVALKHL